MKYFFPLKHPLFSFALGSHTGSKCNLHFGEQFLQHVTYFVTLEFKLEYNDPLLMYIVWLCEEQLMEKESL